MELASKALTTDYCSLITEMTVADIQAPIAAEMELFERKFRDLMKSDVMLLDQIMNYIVKRKGKQLRPMFVFLMAGVCGTITESTYRGASLIELLHTATLVHDDVVDESNYRRGFFAINHLNTELYPRDFNRHWLGRWLIGATHHSLHHTQFRFNYGLYFTFWDKWMRTESPDFHKVFEEKTKV